MLDPAVFADVEQVRHAPLNRFEVGDAVYIKLNNISSKRKCVGKLLQLILPATGNKQRFSVGLQDNGDLMTLEASLSKEMLSDFVLYKSVRFVNFIIDKSLEYSASDFTYGQELGRGAFGLCLCGKVLTHSLTYSLTHLTTYSLTHSQAHQRRHECLFKILWLHGKVSNSFIVCTGSRDHV